MTQNETKYGYVITCTEGLIEEGNYVLSADGIANGVISPASAMPMCELPAAVFATREEAEKALSKLSAKPLIDGLGVESAYVRAFDYLYDGVVAGMNGFNIPIMDWT